MKNKTVVTIILVYFLLIGAVCGYAAEEAKDVEDIVELDLNDLLNVEISVASKKAEGVEDAPGSLTVINRQLILDMNPRSLRDVLNIFVPGMDVVPTYFRYGDRVNEGIYSRGLLSDFSQQVLLLYNGRTKFNETTFGSAFPAIEFTLDNIERIEISRSPIPLYGGNAITTINLVTREQSMKYFDSHVAFSFDRDTTGGDLVMARRFSFAWGGNVKKWHLGFSGQYYDDKGQPHPEPAGTGGYPYDPDTLRDGTKGAGMFTFSADSEDGKLSIQSMYKFNKQDAFLSGQVPSQNTDIYSYEGMEWHGSIKYALSKQFTLTAGGMLAKFKNFVDFLGEPYGGEEYNYDVFLEGIYMKDFKGKSTHSLLAGFKVEREGQYDGQVYYWNGSGFDIYKDEDLIFAPNESRNVLAFMMEDQWHISKQLKLVGGFRFDYFDGFRDKTESVFNPRLALLYKPSKTFLLKALFATAARPPSIYERMGVALVPLKGSPDVNSEKVQTFEISGIFKTGNLKLQLTPFFQVFKDKIEYLPGDEADAGFFVAANSGKTEVKGIDVEAFYYFTRRTYLFLTLSKFKSEDKERGRDTDFLPNLYINGVFNWNFGAFNLNVSAYYRNERKLDPRLEVNREYAAGSHFLSNLNMSYKINDSLEVYLMAENITDETNFVPLSIDQLFVPLRRRTIHTGVRFSIR
jgi:outer membrane receptor for ferrienterochelin and colicins